MDHTLGGFNMNFGRAAVIKDYQSGSSYQCQTQSTTSGAFSGLNHFVFYFFYFLTVITGIF